MKKSLPIIFAVAVASIIQACSSFKPIAEEVEIVELDTLVVDSDNPRDIYRASETRINDLLHTKLEVSFNWDSAFLYGKSTLTLKPYYFPTDTVVLDAKGFQIHNVALLDEIGKKTQLNYDYDSSFLKIQLDRKYTRKDTYQLFIDYTAMPNKLKEGGSAAITSDKGLYFINNDGKDPKKPKQIWTQGETEASSCWFPTIDSPNEKTTQEIYITVDSNYVTLSNGALIFQTENEDGTRTDYWKQKLPHAPYLFMMAVGEFAIVKDEWRGKPVHYYVEPEYEAFARDIYPNTVEMLEFFSKKFGYEFPWDKYHQIVVRDYVSGAMENTGAVIFGDFVQGNDRFLVDNAAEDIVSHELVHHWFGDLVTCESWSNLPLNESFATYGSYLWNEHKYGKDEADLGGLQDQRVYFNSSRINKKQLIRFKYGDRMEMFDAHSYQKGGRVLHMLRNQIGDEAFFDGLALYLKDNEFKPAEIHNLRLAFEEITGQDLNWFFNQWFLSAGHPIIKVEKRYIDSIKQFEVTLKQTQEGDNIPEIFEVYTSIGIVDADGNFKRFEVYLDERTETFFYDYEQEPILVNIDVDKTLLADIDQAIDRDDAVPLYNNATNYIDKYYALRKLKNSRDSTAFDVIEKALNDDFWAVRKAALDNSKNLAKERGESTLSAISNLAEKDEKSNVREAAYSALGRSFEEEVSIAFLEKGTQDISYNVVSSSLDAIHEKDAEAGIKAAEKLESEDNNTLLYTIARIYSNEGDPKRKSFFLSALDELDGFGKYPMILSFSDFMEKQSLEGMESSVDDFKSMSMGDDSWFLRMAAVNGLIKMKETAEEEIEKANSSSKEEEVQTVEEKMELANANKLAGRVVEALKDIKADEDNENLLRIINAELKKE